MLLYRISSVAILLWHCCIVVQTAKRRFNLEIYNFTCSNPANLLLENDCHFTKLATNNFTFTRRFMFQRDVAKETGVHLLIQVLPQNGKKSLNFIDFKINLCDGLSLTMQNPLIKVLIDEMRRTGNLPYSCPLKAGILYTMENYSVTDKTLPPYSPFMNFTMSLMFYEHDLLTCNMQITGAVGR